MSRLLAKLMVRRSGRPRPTERVTMRPTTSSKMVESHTRKRSIELNDDVILKYVKTNYEQIFA